MKVLSVVGCRPQFVKAFPVSRALRRDHEEVLVHTGQHYDEEMSAVFFAELGIPEPDYDLGVGSDSHAAQTAAMMTDIEPVVRGEDPDVVLVYGDTNSTLAAALVAAKVDATLAHVEAGMRSRNRDTPEEVNRVLTDHAADLLLVPTEAAVETLEREGLGDRAHWTGDVMYDTLQWARDRAAAESTVLGDAGVDPGEYVLATVHRAVNTDDADTLAGIVDALATAPRPVVFPVHPRTESRLRAFGLLERAAEALTLVDPVGYLDFVRLVDGAERVATDSGGVQKEAFYLDTPCVTLREETEWTETVECGWNTLVGADPARIALALADPFDAPEKPQPYGDGDAAALVVEALERVAASPPTP